MAPDARHSPTLNLFHQRFMPPEPITNPQRWDDAASHLPHHHILQSWAWGDFKARWGWTPTRLLWRDGERVVGAAQLLRRSIPRTPLGIGYVSKGPLLATEDVALAQRVLADIEAEARRQRCLLVKIDPDIASSNQGLLTLLRARGWQPGEAIQFPNTGVIDLRPDEETLLAQMHQKWRYNIRLANRRGTEVRAGSSADYERFYQMYRETSERDAFLIRPRDYYLDLWHDFDRRGLAHLLLAWVEEEPVAGMILFRYGTRVWYFYGASTSRHRSAMPNHALQWEAIRWAKAQGATEYDLWGAPSDLDDPDDPMAGVWRFKEGFNAQFREQIGAWDYPVSRIGYRLYTEGIPRLRSRLRRGSSQQDSPPG